MDYYTGNCKVGGDGKVTAFRSGLEDGRERRSGLCNVAQVVYEAECPAQSGCNQGAERIVRKSVRGSIRVRFSVDCGSKRNNVEPNWWRRFYRAFILFSVMVLLWHDQVASDRVVAQV